MKIKLKWLVSLMILAISAPAQAYHPLNTEDPGTVEFRHFEMEGATYFFWPQDNFENIRGYLAFKGGIAPRLEFDTVVGFVPWLTTIDEDGKDGSTSGWGNVEMWLKYRFLGDGDGPFNLGALAGAVFPAGMERVEEGGEFIVPAALIFGSVGAGKFRVLMSAGVNWLPEENDTMLYGGALEYSPSEKLALVAEITGESDFERGGGNDPARVGCGVTWNAVKWLWLSLGGHWGISPDAEKFYLTFATNVGW